MFGTEWGDKMGKENNRFISKPVALHKHFTWLYTLTLIQLL